MPNILTGWGLLDPDKVERWSIEIPSVNKVCVKSWVGDNCSSAHYLTSENFMKLKNLKSYSGLFVEAVKYVLEKPNENGNPIHFFEATDIIEEIAEIIAAEPPEDSQSMEALYRAVLSASEGSLISITGITPLLSRVEAYMLIKNMKERPAHGYITVQSYAKGDIQL